MNEKNTFKLNELNQEFWNKVIFIEIQPSSGMGGPGCLWLITSDVKLYYIGFDGFPYEGKLGEFHSMFSRVYENGEYHFKAESLGFQRYENRLVFVKEEYYERYREEYYNMWHKNVGRIHYIHEPDVMARVLGVDEIERLDYDVSVRKREEFQAFIDKCEKEHKEKELSEKHFNWLPLYPNNIPGEGGDERGWYCLLFKECDGKIDGHRFTILYQREEIKPLCGYLNAKIEKYILLERRYYNVIGNLKYKNPMEEWNDLYEYTLTDGDVNNYGEFIRAFDTLEAAKNYAIAVTNIRSYANLENIITGDKLDNHRLIKESVLKKYQGIIMLREYAPKIIEFISKYEFPSECCAGGGYYIPEIAKEFGLDRDEVIEILSYLPAGELLPRSQREAEEILKKLN